MDCGKFTFILERLCLFNGCTVAQLTLILRQSKKENLKFLRQQGQLYTNHTSEPFKVRPDDISIYSASQLYAFGTHRSRTTVEQYYMVKYGITLRYAHLPCLIMNGGRGHVSFFPLECLVTMKSVENIIITFDNITNTDDEYEDALDFEN
jgi:hypothetical protein